MKLGIIGAMDVEVATLKAKMENVAVQRHAGSEYFEGVLEGGPAVVVQCGVGKVNAALCAQVLVSVYGVTHIVNTGIAGSLCADLDIGDLVISRDAMYHDFDCVHFGYEMGKVPGMDVVAFPADNWLMEQAVAAAEAVNPGHSRVGRDASGDLFVAAKPAKEAIIASLRTERVNKSSILWNYVNAQDMNRTEDIRKLLYEKIQSMTLQDVIKFQQEWVKGRTYHYGILGKKEDLDMEALKKMGTVVELTTEDIFGY